MSDDILSGIVIGAVGGAAAGIALWLLERVRECEKAFRERRRILKWLDGVTSQPGSSPWRSTRAIASFTNLTEERVRYLCSIHPKIELSTGQNEVWSIKGRARDAADSGTHLSTAQ